MATNTMEVIDRGIRCLSENMGIVDAEEFISVIIREQFDYTKWHRAFADSMDKTAVKRLVKESAANNTYGGNPATIM